MSRWFACSTALLLSLTAACTTLGPTPATTGHSAETYFSIGLPGSTAIGGE